MSQEHIFFFTQLFFLFQKRSQVSIDCHMHRKELKILHVFQLKYTQAQEGKYLDVRIIIGASEKHQSFKNME